jgi:hypothetical protein
MRNLESLPKYGRSFVCLNTINAAAAYGGYRDTPEIGTLSTTRSDGRVSPVP